MDYQKETTAGQPDGTNITLCLLHQDSRWKLCDMQIRIPDLIRDFVFLASHQFSGYMWRTELNFYLPLNI